MKKTYKISEFADVKATCTKCGKVECFKLKIVDDCVNLDFKKFCNCWDEENKPKYYVETEYLCND